MLLYGDTNATKTTQIGFLAKEIFASTGKRTRMLSADSTWDPIEPLVRTTENPDGIIEVFHLQRLKTPLSGMVKFGNGWWPNLNDKTGKLEFAPPTPTTFNDYGLYAIEGLSTISDMLLQDHIANRRVIGQEVVGKFDVPVDVAGGTSEILHFAKSAMTHFGHVQDFVLLDLVPRFAALPLEWVVWTAHEARGKDEITGKPIALGPATIGKAAVGVTARKFGHTLHLMREAIPGGNKMEVRAYFTEHPERDTIPPMYWPAKVSLPPEQFKILDKETNGKGYMVLSLEGGVERLVKLRREGK